VSLEHELGEKWIVLGEAEAVVEAAGGAIAGADPQTDAGVAEAGSERADLSE
jgi:hypothetical protein